MSETELAREMLAAEFDAIGTPAAQIIALDIRENRGASVVVKTALRAIDKALSRTQVGTSPLREDGAVKTAIKSAYSEGWYDGGGVDCNDMNDALINTDWKRSNARAALTTLQTSRENRDGERAAIVAWLHAAAARTSSPEQAATFSNTAIAFERGDHLSTQTGDE